MEAYLPAKDFSPRLRGWLVLLAWGIGLWCFFEILTPRLISLSSNWQKYNRVQEEMGLDSGAMYYTNVPVSLDCERANRAAVERGMAARREGRTQEK